jgi:hypothetical protein
MRHNPRLVITRSLLTQALRALERTNRQWVACGVETSRRQDGVDWLGRPLLSEWNPSQSAPAHLAHTGVGYRGAVACRCAVPAPG